LSSHRASPRVAEFTASAAPAAGRTRPLASAPSRRTSWPRRPKKPWVTRMPCSHNKDGRWREHSAHPTSGGENDDDCRRNEAPSHT
jgi:hypothetical protein